MVLTGTAGRGSRTWGRPGLCGSWPGVPPPLQVIVQSGRHPTVLQKLCQLPFQYFSDPRLIKVLFPSLIAACYNNLQNKVILEQEMSCVLLATFIQVPFYIYAKFSYSVWKLMRLKNKSEPAVYPCHPHYPQISPIMCSTVKIGVKLGFKYCI